MVIKYSEGVLDKLTDKKKEELPALIFLLHNEYGYLSTGTIENADEEPDFEIRLENNKETIGVEHRRCFRDNVDSLTEVQVSFTKICESIISELKEIAAQNINPNGEPNHLIVQVFRDKMYAKKSNEEKKKVSGEIKMLLMHKYLGTQRSKTDYIYDASFYYDPFIFNHDIKIDIEPTMANYISFLTQLNPDPVLECIAEKEKKLTSYRQLDKNKDIKRWWLIVEIPRTSFLDTYGYKLPTGFSSNYDKIFIVKMHSRDIGTYKIYDRLYDFTNKGIMKDL